MVLGLIKPPNIGAFVMQRSIYSGGGGSAGVDRLRKDSCSEMIYKSHRISLSTGRSGVGESEKMFAQSCCWFNKIPRLVHIGIYFSCQRGGVGVDVSQPTP
ncbi:hypothetical protein ILYODFUR_010295 [Ilyodon furcidens]|uniref:Uncharacterized protein n=1 Tax=Ilyodon furcidens TaxID=33524 RepID=A0ABV0V3Z3_9TELE